jgi:hypothetical protein
VAFDRRDLDAWVDDRKCRTDVPRRRFRKPEMQVWMAYWLWVKQGRPVPEDMSLGKEIAEILRAVSPAERGLAALNLIRTLKEELGQWRWREL